MKAPKVIEMYLESGWRTSRPCTNSADGTAGPRVRTPLTPSSGHSGESLRRRRRAGDLVSTPYKLGRPGAGVKEGVVSSRLIEARCSPQTMCPSSWMSAGRTSPSTIPLSYSWPTRAVGSASCSRFDGPTLILNRASRESRRVLTATALIRRTNMDPTIRLERTTCSLRDPDQPEEDQ